MMSVWSSLSLTFSNPNYSCTLAGLSHKRREACHASCFNPAKLYVWTQTRVSLRLRSKLRTRSLLGRPIGAAALRHSAKVQYKMRVTAPFPTHGISDQIGMADGYKSTLNLT